MPTPQQPQLRQSQGLTGDILGELRHNVGSVLQQALDPTRQAMLGATDNAAMAGVDLLSGLARGVTVPLEQRYDPTVDLYHRSPTEVRQRGNVLGDILGGMVPLGGPELIAEKAAMEEAPQISRNAVEKITRRRHPTDFQGTLDLYHGSKNPNLRRFNPGNPDPEFHGPDNVFGAQGVYLDQTGKWSRGDMGRWNANHVYKVRAPFQRAFVLSPKTTKAFRQIVGDMSHLINPYGSLMNDAGDHVVNALKARGYDGLIVHGFDEAGDAAVSKATGGITDFRDNMEAFKSPEHWESVLNKGQRARERLEKKHGINEYFQQDQVVHFKPEKVAITHRVHKGELPVRGSLEPQKVDPTAKREAPPPWTESAARYRAEVWKNKKAYRAEQSAKRAADEAKKAVEARKAKSGPRLRSAFKSQGKLYVAEPGENHRSAVEVAMKEQNAQWEPKGEFGYINERGRWVSRSDALQRAVNEDMILPHLRRDAIDAMNRTGSGFYGMGAELPSEWLKPEHK